LVLSRVDARRWLPAHDAQKAEGANAVIKACFRVQVESVFWFFDLFRRRQRQQTFEDVVGRMTARLRVPRRAKWQQTLEAALRSDE
jgi:hypothetical protein